MKSLPLISVIVPSYNHIAFVTETLESVLAQSYGPLELIVLDDRSTDGSAIQIQAWFERPGVKERWVRWVFEVNPENLGAHATLNRGAGLAQGGWLAFLNSDDRYHPLRLERLQACLGDAKWGFSGVRVVDEAGVFVPRTKLPAEVGFVYEGIAHAQERYPSLSCALLERNFVVSTGNILVSADLFRKVGGFKNLRYLHDWDFLLSAILYAEPVALDEPLYDYRLHGANSFKSLAYVAAREGCWVLQNYLRAAQMKPANRLAPSPWNWPVLFNHWIDQLGLQAFSTPSRTKLSSLT